MVVGAQGRRLLHEAVRAQRCQFAPGCRNQPFDHLRRELHVALKAIHPIAVFDDLTRASFAECDDFRVRGQSGHVAMPVVDRQAASEVGELVVRLAICREHDGKLTDLPVRAALMGRTQRRTQQLRTQADTDDRLCRRPRIARSGHIRRRRRNAGRAPLRSGTRLPDCAEAIL